MPRFFILSLVSFLFVFTTQEAYAGDLSYVPPGGKKEGITQTPDESALNYFASGQHTKKALEAQKNLPSKTTLDGKATLKVRDGQLITSKDQNDQAYIDCMAFASEMPENIPDGCKQHHDSQDTATSAPIEKIGTRPAPEPTDGDVTNKVSIMDRKNNVQMNIISNTDTGVELGR